MKINPNFDKNNVQWVRASDSHPQADSMKWVGKDGKLREPIIVKRKRCKCK